MRFCLFIVAVNCYITRWTINGNCIITHNLQLSRLSSYCALKFAYSHCDGLQESMPRTASLPSFN